jgi:glycosyltransferase involved in cell wall biosynthesis
MYSRARVIIKEKKCDVISSQDTYFLGLLAWVLSKQYHLGLEVQVLGIEKLSFFRKALSKFVLARAGSIRVLSLGLKKRLIQEFGISEKRMKLVPIYVDVSSLGFNQNTQSDEEKNDLQVQNDLFQKAYGGRFNIVSVNRLVPIKNISMQLHAIASLCREYPNILLHVVGDGPLQAEIETEIKNLHIEDFVVLQGFKSGVTLSPFFTQSDCFVLTSNFEGYGMVVVEAATVGLPIVMTDVGCAGEVIINGKSGMIVPPQDTAAFTQALRSVITDESLRTKFGLEARESVAQLPSFDRVLENYKASWQQALDNR